MGSETVSNRNKFVRWIMPGCWEDADGHPHFDVPAIHQWMRDKGLKIEDTPEEMADTMRMLQTELHKHHPHAKTIVRTSPD